MEIGNRNGNKQTKKLLVHIMTGFMSHTLCLHSCTVLCDDLFSVIDLPIAEILGAAKAWDLKLG